jgi:hypothetical protein
MERRIPWLWIGVAAALLLLPTSAGRLLLDVVGGLTLTLLLLPLLLGATALIGWQLLRNRLRTCPSCGVSSFGTSVCPACGGSFGGDELHAPADSPQGSPYWQSGAAPELDARDATITVKAIKVEAFSAEPTDQEAPTSQEGSAQDSV